MITTTKAFKTYEDVDAWLQVVCSKKIKPGLERMHWLLARLNYPHRRCKFIHIAGTNGKGSTAAMVSSILQESGYKTGLYVSPAVVKWSERIQVNGAYIKESSYVRWANFLGKFIEELRCSALGSPSIFEFYTILALCYFAFETYPDFVVWETGLGGTWDATNVVHPLACLITQIGKDHQELLGSTIQEIAMNKAGIIKPAVPVVCSNQVDEATNVIKEWSQKMKSPLYLSGNHFRVNGTCTNKTLKPFACQEFNYQSSFGMQQIFKAPLLGDHQLQNAATALMGLEVLRQYYAVSIDIHSIQKGFAKVVWPGRMEVVKRSPTIILDGAHNHDGLQALVSTLTSGVSYKDLYVMIGCMEDKDIQPALANLANLATKIVTTQVDMDRSLPMNLMTSLVKKHAQCEVVPVESPDLGLKKMDEWAKEEDVILITGSLYLVSHVRKAILG